MRIRRIVCAAAIEEKLARKHHVTVREARQILLAATRIRFAEQGYTPGEDVYVAFGQTWGGRYMAVFFVFKPNLATAIIISAREMTAAERKRYGQK